MKHYEYNVITFTLANPVALQEHLNAYGLLGWELVDVENFDIMGLLIFKREIQ